MSSPADGVLGRSTVSELRSKLLAQASEIRITPLLTAPSVETSQSAVSPVCKSGELASPASRRQRSSPSQQRDTSLPLLPLPLHSTPSPKQPTYELSPVQVPRRAFPRTLPKSASASAALFGGDIPARHASAGAGTDAGAGKIADEDPATFPVRYCVTRDRLNTFSLTPQPCFDGHDSFVERLIICRGALPPGVGRLRDALAVLPSSSQCPPHLSIANTTRTAKTTSHNHHYFRNTTNTIPLYYSSATAAK